MYSIELNSEMPRWATLSGNPVIHLDHATVAIKCRWLLNCLHTMKHVTDSDYVKDNEFTVCCLPVSHVFICLFVTRCSLLCWVICLSLVFSSGNTLWYHSGCYCCSFYHVSRMTSIVNKLQKADKVSETHMLVSEHPLEKSGWSACVCIRDDPRVFVFIPTSCLQKDLKSIRTNYVQFVWIHKGM